MSAQSGLSRAIKQLNDSNIDNESPPTSNRGQKDVIIRKNSSKKIMNRPISQNHREEPNMKKMHGAARP